MKSPLIALLLMSFTVQTFADDWTQWRGPNREGRSTEKGLLESWPEGGPSLSWKATGFGVGYSSVVIADGRIFTMGDRDGASCVIAVSEKTGKPIWVSKIGEDGGHKRYKGTRSTPTVDGNDVVALNQHGDIACLDARNGSIKWNVNVREKFAGRMMSGWRYSESPLIDGSKVVCTPGGSEGAVVALDRKTGKKLWETSTWTDFAAYSSVIIAAIHGKRQYVQLTGKSVAGIDPDTGKILWKAERAGKTAVIATPIVHNNRVFVTSSYGVGCAGFEIAKDGSVKELFKNKSLSNHHGGVVRIGDHVYGATGGTFRCVDMRTGEQVWNERSVGKGATVYVDGKFILRSENGPVALIEASPEGYQEVSKFKQPERTREKAWPHPVVANGRLYLRDQDTLLFFNVSK